MYKKKNSFFNTKNNIKPSRQEVVRSLNESLEKNDLAILRLKNINEYLKGAGIENEIEYVPLSISRDDYKSFKYCEFVCQKLEKFYKDGLKKNGIC